MCNLQFLDNVVDYINVREYRRSNQKWTIQRNWQHRGTQEEEKQNKKITQYVLDIPLYANKDK